MKRIAIVTLLAVLAGCASMQVSAARVMKDGQGNSARLTEEPCTATGGVFAQMPAELRPQFRAASIYWQGKTYAACWMALDDEYTFLVDESGDSGAVPTKNFVRETEI